MVRAMRRLQTGLLRSTIAGARAPAGGGGRRYISAALAEILVADLDGDSDKPLHARLSAREFQIFCKLAAGRGVSDIANELSLSVKTVSTYRSRILEKMSFSANADITSYALRNGLIQ